MVEKAKEIPARTVVVVEYPTTQLSELMDEKTGEKIKLISLTEAITEMYSDIKEIKSKL